MTDLDDLDAYIIHVAELQAEIERLRAEAEHHLQAYQIMFNQTERLRAALQQIVAEADSDDGLTAWDGADIARAALEPKP